MATFSTPTLEHQMADESKLLDLPDISTLLSSPVGESLVARKRFREFTGGPCASWPNVVVSDGEDEDDCQIKGSLLRPAPSMSLPFLGHPTDLIETSDVESSPLGNALLQRKIAIARAHQSAAVKA